MHEPEEERRKPDPPPPPRAGGASGAESAADAESASGAQNASGGGGASDAENPAQAEGGSEAHTVVDEVLDEVTPEVLDRAARIAEATGHVLLAQMVARGRACALQALNNALMDTFREHQHRDAFALLFELNLRPFSLVAARFLRMTGSRADVNDILQETFLAIHRYPTKFQPDRRHAFRNWSHSIIRNVVYRHNQHDMRDGIPAEMLADVLEDTRTPSPSSASEEAESELRCRRIYGLMLQLYLQAYNDLPDRARRALDLVEVQGLGYREATLVLGIRLENFKMVVCRARKAILQSMIRVLGTRLP